MTNQPTEIAIVGGGMVGGALALGVANHILMLENAVYSVLSPEGFASILWKDSSRSGEACEIMKLTAQDLYKDGDRRGESSRSLWRRTAQPRGPRLPPWIRP